MTYITRMAKCKICRMISSKTTSGDSYFTGGYNTVRHGSRDGGATDAIQMECYFAGLRDTAENRALNRRVEIDLLQ